jgi:hypothetical protein
MFRIEFFVEDKHVAKVLHSLAGVALNLSTQSVANAVPTKGKKVVAKLSGGSIKDRVIELVQKHESTDLSTDELRAIIKEAGGMPISIGTYRNYLVEAKVIKMVSRGYYKILKKAE